MNKFQLPQLRQFFISRIYVIATVENPDFIDYSRSPLLIAQRKLDESHALRVVYKKELDRKIVITFYPARTKRYEKKS